jgi:hypothetical protein
MHQHNSLPGQARDTPIHAGNWLPTTPAASAMGVLAASSRFGGGGPGDVSAPLLYPPSTDDPPGLLASDAWAEGAAGLREPITC